MIHGWRAAALLAALAGAGAPVAAQVRGIPVDNSGVPRGIGIHGTVGFANDDAGGGTGYGLTGKVGFGALGVTGSISTSDPDASDLALGDRRLPGIRRTAGAVVGDAPGGGRMGAGGRQ